MGHYRFGVALNSDSPQSCYYVSVEKAQFHKEVSHGKEKVMYLVRTTGFNWRSRTVILTLLLGLSCPLFAQDSATLKGRVLDPDGAAIPNSVVMLFWNNIGADMSWNSTQKKRKPPQKRTVSVITDSSGSFSLNVPPGTWDIYVHADGIRPICQVLGLEAGKTEEVELRMTQRVRKMQE